MTTIRSKRNGHQPKQTKKETTRHRKGGTCTRGGVKKGGKMAVGGKAVKIASTCRQGKDDVRRRKHVGIRQQGGRIYDSERGTTCHQCRQKTVELKMHCRDGNGKCNLYWCSRCLENRYNEVLEEIVGNKAWTCPKCRNICNCSCCRRKNGLEATGILANVAKSAGFQCVSELLKENPHASAKGGVRKTNGKKHGKIDNMRRLPRKKCTTGERAISPRKEKKGQRTRGIHAEQVDCDDSRTVHECAPSNRKTIDFMGVEDSTLPRRALPKPISFGVYDLSSNKKVKLNHTMILTQLPTECRDQLLCVLEFIANFAWRPLGLEEINLNGRRLSSKVFNKTNWVCFQIAEEILKDASKHNSRASRSTYLGKLISRLQTIICEWNETSEDLKIPWDEWIEKRYREFGSNHGSFLERPLAQKIHAIFEVIHDALQCGPFQEVIDSELDKTKESEELRRANLRQVKEEIKQERERLIQDSLRRMICSKKSYELSSQAQYSLIDAARLEADKCLGQELKAKLRWLMESDNFRNPVLRNVGIGKDRDGITYFALRCAPICTGAPDGILAMTQDGDMMCFNNCSALEAAMDIGGNSEGALKIALQHYKETIDEAL